MCVKYVTATGEISVIKHINSHRTFVSYNTHDGNSSFKWQISRSEFIFIFIFEKSKLRLYLVVTNMYM